MGVRQHVGLILHTTRGTRDTQPAIEWFKERNIPLLGVGQNPLQQTWTDTKKSYGYYIDDVSVGIPLKYEEGERPRVDWEKLDEFFTPKLEWLNKLIEKNKKR